MLLPINGDLSKSAICSTFLLNETDFMSHQIFVLHCTCMFRTSNYAFPCMCSQISALDRS